MISKIIKLTIIFFFFFSKLQANTEFFKKGLSLYNDKKFNEAKFKFEQDIVFNPKSEMSYLYLSKIFKKQKKRDLEELNLNTVILINPENEEAIYSLAKLKLENSDYKKSRELNDTLKNFCKKLCIQSKKLEIEIDNLSKN